MTDVPEPSCPPTPHKCDSDDCSICLQPMRADACGNDATATLPCNHKFHVSCVLRLARSNDANHGRCPLCRAVDPVHEHEDSDDELEVAPEPTVRESSQSLLERAIILSNSGEGSAVLRRHCRTLSKIRDEKHRAIAAAAEFKTTHAKIMKQYGALRLAKKRAAERQQQMRQRVVAHMRLSGLD